MKVERVKFRVGKRSLHYYSFRGADQDSVRRRTSPRSTPCILCYVMNVLLSLNVVVHAVSLLNDYVFNVKLLTVTIVFIENLTLVTYLEKKKETLI